MRVSDLHAAIAIRRTIFIQNEITSSLWHSWWFWSCQWHIKFIVLQWYLRWSFRDYF